ncbi:flavin-containing monooxygenase 5-like [Mytilus galloprovincialis]|uniref:flavin-containing monooxygenase 5-like n=1 Tax=Mytilus galloprovincialis TaxID=29158 RepID=UPI003F7C62B5
MSSQDQVHRPDVIVIGAGISGLVTAKCLREAGLSVVVLERSGDIGGLWTFRENDYGVMRFTHINVSKYNYCFSDFPFPDDVPDYPHNVDMAKYIKSYTNHFKLNEIIKLYRKVVSIERQGEDWKVIVQEVEEDGITVKPDTQEVYLAKNVAIASGHHSKPTMAKFMGQDSFTGEIIHSVKYKDVITNHLEDKRVLVVGIGNSAVDVAVNIAAIGREKPVYLSTRSGAWVVPNYIFGQPTDLYANRLFLALPWKLATWIFETVIKVVSGDPKRWGLNPKMRALQTQPTVSPTLLHHIQRKNIVVVPNIQRIENKKVYFINGESAEFDSIILCTGYKIDLPFLSDEIKQTVLDDNNNNLKLFKNVFNPDIGQSLAFIGFVQPASGGILTMSETQARWYAELIKGRVHLPNKSAMEDNMRAEEIATKNRYYHSARHTIQKDPITYNDEISSYFGAKPELLTNPTLAWRLIFGSCGAFQYRLQGPNTWSGAKEAVKKVPVTEMMNYSGIGLLVLAGLVLYYFYSFICCVFC